MEQKTELLINFLKNNPNATKLAISDAIDFKGLPLFNLLKKLEAEGTISIQGDGDDKTFSLTESIANDEDVNDDQNQDDNDDEGAGEEVNDDNGAADEGQNDQPEQTDGAAVDNNSENNDFNADQASTDNNEGKPAEEPVIVSTGRDNSKYKFEGQEYGKGPVVRAVVSKHVANNPGITFEQLKTAFPDDLLKRFGIFQTVEKAKEIANKGNRYFTKDEQIIALADAKVVVCNQFTLENLQPFLKIARALGYVIE